MCCYIGHTLLTSQLAGEHEIFPTLHTRRGPQGFMIFPGLARSLLAELQPLSANGTATSFACQARGEQLPGELLTS